MKLGETLAFSGIFASIAGATALSGVWLGRRISAFPQLSHTSALLTALSFEVSASATLLLMNHRVISDQKASRLYVPWVGGGFLLATVANQCIANRALNLLSNGTIPLIAALIQAIILNKIVHHSCQGKGGLGGGTSD